VNFRAHIKAKSSWPGKANPLKDYQLFLVVRNFLF